MRESLQKKGFWALLAGVFLLMLVLNALTPMLADDYFYAYSFETGERITSVWQIAPSLLAHGREMNGRYAPHFFVQLFTMLPEGVFDVCNALMYMALLWGLYALTRGRRRYDLALLAVLTALMFVVLPDFGGPMLWLAGSCNYLWCAAGAVWLAKSVKDALINGAPAPGARLLAALCALGLAVGNCSENMSATVGLLLVAAALYRRLAQKAPCAWLLALAASVLAGWLALVLAPGDSGRIGRAFSGGLGVSYYTERFLEALAYYRESLTGLTAAYCFLLAFAFAGGVARETRAFSVALFAGALVCNAAMAIADYYPARSMLWPSLLIVAACAMLAAPLGESAKPLWRGAALFLALLMAFSVCEAIPGNYNRYALYRARMAEMEAERDAGVQRIQTYGIAGRTPYDAFGGLVELTTDAEYRSNRALAKYLGVSAVVAERFE